MNQSADYEERLTNVEKILETLVQQKGELYHLAELQHVVMPEKMTRAKPARAPRHRVKTR